MPILDDWVTVEAPLAPNVPIIDPHHHFFPVRPRAQFPADMAAVVSNTYGRVHAHEGFSDDNLARESKGMGLITTVYMEATAFYTKGVLPHLRPVGETEHVAAVCAKTRGTLCRGTVAMIDLALPREQVLEALAAHRKALEGSGCVLGGVRLRIAHDALNEVVSAARYGLAHDAQVQENARLMGSEGLVVDVWLYHTQLDDLYRLAASAPGTTFVCDHIATPIRVASRAERLEAVWDEWCKGMARLAELRNVVVKFGGLTMQVGGLTKDAPYASSELARVLQPWFDVVAVELFPGRVMMESNFPMDKASASYMTLWNAFLRLTKGVSPEQRADLVYECANRTYKLGLPTRDARDFVLPSATL